MMIDHEYLKSVLDYNPTTGLFTWKIQINKIHPGTIAGRIRKDGYLQIMLKRHHYLAHRLAWFYMTGEWPEFYIDHKNGIRHDIRWNNLRNCKIIDNNQNRKLQSNSKTRMTGVCWHKATRKWRAYISINNKWKHLGYYSTREAAYTAYLWSKQDLHNFQTRPRES